MNTLNLFLIIAACLSGLAAWLGIRSVASDCKRSRLTMVFIALSFLFQLYVLRLRGAERGGCPLCDPGEILIFLAWSLTLFYLLVGPTYRISLLGVFTAPVVAVSLFVAGIPGMLDTAPERIETLNYWWEMHTAFSVLSYGALALGSIAAIMFVVMNSYLKNAAMSSSLFKTMPPIHTLVSSMVRLTTLGVICLTIGLVSGIMMDSAGGAHFVIAAISWGAYLALLGVWFIWGITPKRMAILVVTLFVISLTVFGAL